MIGYLTQDHTLVTAFRPRATLRTRRETLALNRIFKRAPKLSDYFREDEIGAVRGEMDRPISGVVMDSRRAVPGSLFFALPGKHADGISFIDEAVNRGAVAIVVAKMPISTPARVTFIQTADPRSLLAKVAQRFYKFPDRDLNVVGVTGTNGKTTVTYLIQHFLGGDQRVGLLGTINYDLGGRTVPSNKTTPESLETFGLLAQMRAAGCRQAVMEVSSHGIDQKRVLGLQFGAAVFTNLSRDHLDYHRTLEAYFSVKSRLFTVSEAKVAVINLDDPYGEKLLGLVPPQLTRVTFGENPRAMVRAEQVELGLRTSTFKLVWPKSVRGSAAGENEMWVNSPLIGSYNVSNLLAAIATAWSLGRDPIVFLTRLKNFTGVPGRMERIDAGQSFQVMVDYAHTDDALRHALSMLRAITPGRLFVVFGCSGNRDRTKRASMVKVAQELADFTFATADNPRGESLAQIFADMRAGTKAPEKITWIDDRRRAIGIALDGARPGDCVLVAGKGHESYQELGDTVIPFDDRQVVRELIEQKIALND